MFLEKILEKLPVQSHRGKWIAGSGITALLISLGIVLAYELLKLSMHPAIPAIFAAIGAAAYAVRYHGRDS